MAEVVGNPPSEGICPRDCGAKPYVESPGAQDNEVSSIKLEGQEASPCQPQVRSRASSGTDSEHSLYSTPGLSPLTSLLMQQKSLMTKTHEVYTEAIRAHIAQLHEIMNTQRKRIDAFEQESFRLKQESVALKVLLNHLLTSEFGLSADQLIHMDTPIVQYEKNMEETQQILKDQLHSQTDSIEKFSTETQRLESITQDF